MTNEKCIQAARYLLFNPVIDLHAFKLMFCTEKQAREFHDWLVSKQLVTTDEYVATQSLKGQRQRKRYRTQLNYTPKLLQYFSEHDTDFAEALCFSNLDVSTSSSQWARISPKRNYNHSRFGSAFAFAVGMDAYIPYTNFATNASANVDVELDDNDSESTNAIDTSIDIPNLASSRTNLIKRHILLHYLRTQLTPTTFNTYLTQTHILADASSEIIFHSGNIVKIMCSTNTGSNMQPSYDIQKSRISGIFDSPKKSIMFYADILFGFEWGPAKTESEMKIARLWQRKYNKITIQSSDMRSGLQQCEAAIALHTVQQICELVLDVDRKNIQNEVFASFSAVYGVPFNRIGVSHLKWLLCDADNAMNDIRNSLLASGSYEINHGVWWDVFPFVHTKTEQLTYIGIDLNLKEILRVYNVAFKYPDRNIEILCDWWQKPYYEELLGAFPNITITNLTSNPNRKQYFQYSEDWGISCSPIGGINLTNYVD